MKEKVSEQSKERQENKERKEKERKKMLLALKCFLQTPLDNQEPSCGNKNGCSLLN